MATQWYWREGDVDRGPVSFRELVAMVRDRALVEEALVRPHYLPEWQEAASVVGLFYMAGRADALARWEQERHLEESARLEVEKAAERDDSRSEPINVGDIDEMLGVAESLSESDFDTEEPAWQRRLREVDAQRKLEEGERHEELVAERFQQLKENAIAAAVANAELKEATKRKRWKWSVVSLHEMFGSSLPWVLSIVAANLVAIGILAWSDTEALRYPDRQAAVAGSRIFPMWGECPAGEYMFLLVDTMLITGVIGYFGGRLLVNMADE